MAKKQKSQPIEEMVPHIQHHWANPMYDNMMDANEAAIHLENIREDHGMLNQYILLDSSRPEESPFHHFFEWCDVIAAEKYRQHQALNIINAHRTVRVDISEISGETKFVDVVVKPADRIPVKTYHRCEVKVKDADGKIHSASDYRTYNKVMEDESVRSQVHDDIYRFFDNARKMFEALTNDEIYGPVIEAMNIALEKVESLKRKQPSPAMASV